MERPRIETALRPGDRCQRLGGHGRRAGEAVTANSAAESGIAHAVSGVPHATQATIMAGKSWPRTARGVGTLAVDGKTQVYSATSSFSARLSPGRRLVVPVGSGGRRGSPSS